MVDINQEIEQLVVEMREVGKQAAPCKGGNYNNLLRYNELQERILSKFLEAFDAGGRLEMPTLTPPNEPLTIEQLREMDGEPAYCCTVQRSKDYHTTPCIIDCGHRAPEIRRPELPRCELFEPGDFKTRFRKGG